jgi:multidrug efflux system membrane fusion protein
MPAPISSACRRLLAKRFITPDKLDSAQTDAEALEAQVKVARAELDRTRNVLGEVNGRNARREAAAAALRDAELKLSYCRIYAPCDGYVTNLQITPGAYAGAGTQMFSLVDRKIWFVLANFRETDLKRIRPGMPAEIYLMADVRRKLKGIVQGVPKAVYLLDAPSALSPGGQGVLSRVSPTLNYSACPTLSRAHRDRRAGDRLVSDGRQRLGDRPHRPGHPGRRGAPAGAATFLGTSLQFPGR